MSGWKNGSAEVERQKESEIICLKFKFIEEDKKQLPAKKMGMVLTSLQDFFDAVCAFEAGFSSGNGRAPKEVLEKTELSVFETFQGSFGIKLALPPDRSFSSAPERPLAEKVAATFFELVKLSDRPEKEELKQLLLNFEKKAASSYRRFLLSLKDLKSDLYLEWGSVNPDAGGRASLSKNSIQTTVKHIKLWEQNQHKLMTVQGKLLTANLTQKTLKIEEIETGKNYSAKFGKDLLNHPEIDLIIGRLYSTKFQEVTSINIVTGEEKTERTVIELAYLNGDLEAEDDEESLTMSLFLDFLMKDVKQNPKRLVPYTEEMSAEIDELLTDVTVEE